MLYSRLSEQQQQKTVLQTEVARIKSLLEEEEEKVNIRVTKQTVETGKRSRGRHGANRVRHILDGISVTPRVSVPFRVHVHVHVHVLCMFFYRAVSLSPNLPNINNKYVLPAIPSTH